MADAEPGWPASRDDLIVMLRAYREENGALVQCLERNRRSSDPRVVADIAHTLEALQPDVSMPKPNA